MEHAPRTLMEAVRYFADADRTLATMVALRWPDGVHCPTCGRTDVRFIATRKLWECKEKHPRKQFSAKVGTIFEDSPLPLDKWFVAVWSIANCKNGISSYELGRAIGVTQKSAWHMLHRGIRLRDENRRLRRNSTPDQRKSMKSYVGGLAKNTCTPRKREERVTGCDRRRRQGRRHGPSGARRGRNAQPSPRPHDQGPARHDAASRRAG